MIRERHEGNSGNVGKGRPSPQKLGDLLSSLRIGEDVPTPADESPSNTTNYRTDRWLSEVNLQRLPFAVLWDKKTGSLDSIIVRRVFLQDGDVMERKWEVFPGSRMGLPGPGAYATFRALEKIVLARTIGRNLPLTNPQEFDLSELLRELGQNADSGRNHERLKNDLRRISDARYVDTGWLRERLPKSKDREGRGSKKRARRRTVDSEARFNLLSQLCFRHESLPDGTVARRNLVWFGDLYMKSVNSGYVKPLDWDLWKSLSRPAARRLFELLDLKLFSTPRAPRIEFDFSELAELLPLKPQRYFADAKKALAGALNEAVDVFLEKSAWRKEQGAWTLELYPSAHYRKRLLARVRPDIDYRAYALADELRDPGSLRLFHRIVTSVERPYIDMALSETRQARLTRTRDKTKKPLNKEGAYFTKTLSEILKRRRLPIPFEQRKGDRAGREDRAS